MSSEEEKKDEPEIIQRLRSKLDEIPPDSLDLVHQMIESIYEE